MSADSYSNIRDFLGQFVGQRLVDITQHDEEEWENGKEAYVCLMFERGGTVTVPIGDDGLEYTDGIE